MEAVSKEERGGDGLIELTTIIVLNYLDGDAKLSLKIGKKNCQGWKRYKT